MYCFIGDVLLATGLNKLPMCVCGGGGPTAPALISKTNQPIEPHQTPFNVHLDCCHEFVWSNTKRKKTLVNTPLKQPTTSNL